MFEDLKLTVQMWYDNFMYFNGPERIELARARLAAHEQAMREGYESPYTDYDNYNMAWEPIVKRLKDSE